MILTLKHGDNVQVEGCYSARFSDLLLSARVFKSDSNRILALKNESMLSDSPQKKVEFVATIKQGDLVEIDGEFYTVRVNGNFMDAVVFKKVD